MPRLTFPCIHQAQIARRYRAGTEPWPYGPVVSALAQDLALYRQVAETVEDDDLRVFAQGAIPQMELHLRTAGVLINSQALARMPEQEE